MKTKTLLFLLLFTNGLFSQNSKSLSKAKIMIEKEEFSKAIPILIKANSIDSSNAEIHYLLAKSYRKLGQYEKTAFHLKKSLALDSLDVETICELGTYYIMKDELTSSIMCYNKAILIDSTNSLSYNCLGALYYYYLSENQMALKNFNLAIKYDTANNSHLFQFQISLV